MLPLHFSKLRSASISNQRETAISICQSLRLPEDVVNMKASELSVGQQQRVAVARALIGNPPLVIADEPTSSLDTDAQNLFLDLMFSQVASSNSTLLMVSHDKSLSSKFDRVIDMKNVSEKE